MPGKSKLNLKKIGTNVANEISRGLGNLANNAAKHGNKDIADAANAMASLTLAGQIDTKLISKRKEADELVTKTLAHSSAIKKNVTVATPLVNPALLEADKVNGEWQQFQIANPNIKIQNEMQAFFDKRTSMTDNLKLLSDLNPVVDKKDQENNPEHLRAIISGATQDSRDPNTKRLDENRAIDIVNLTLAKLTRLEADAKIAFETSKTILNSLRVNVPVLEALIKTARDVMTAALAADKRQREAAELAKRKADADAKAEIERRKAEGEAKKRALLKQLADLEKETETLNGQNPEAAGNPPGGAGITYAFKATAAAAGTSTASGATSASTASASAATPDASLNTDDEVPSNPNKDNKHSHA